MKDGGNRQTNYVKKITPIPSYSGSGGQDLCEITLTAALQNLQPALSSYAEDDVLTVEVSMDGFVIATGKFGPCGTLAVPKTLVLKKCIEDGNRYKATIVSISASTCTVKIRRLL
jgi:hypothetical protein